MSESATVNAMRTDLSEHQAVRAWRKLQPERFEPRQIETLKERKKSAIYRLAGLGLGGSSVIAKRCFKETAAIEHFIYTQVLPQLSIPTLYCYGYVEEPSSNSAWLFLEDTGEEAYSSLLAEHRAAAGWWLGVMHASVNYMSIEAHLPSKGPQHYLEEMRAARCTILAAFANPVLNADDLRLLETIGSQFEVLELHWNQVEKFCDRMPQSLVHGDFAKKNVRVRSNQERISFLPFDWENAGCGTPAVDLAQFAVNSVSPDITVYWSVVRESHPGLDLQAMRRLADLGTIFRLIDAIYWEKYGISYEYWPNHSLAYECAKSTMSKLSFYQASMAEAISALMRGFEWE